MEEVTINGSTYYKIPGTLIDSNGVYYKNSAGNLFNHATYESDPNLEWSESYDNAYQGYLEGLFSAANNADPQQPILYTSDGSALVGPTYDGTTVYTYSGGELHDVGYMNEILSNVITEGSFIMLNTGALLNSSITETNGSLSIYKSSSDGKLISRRAASYTSITFYGLDNYNHSTYMSSMPRGKLNSNVYAYNEAYSNYNYLLSTGYVDTRATCFEPILSILNNNGFSDSHLSGKAETYAPYILNRVGKCVTITHAPDLNICSTINFGDGSTPVTIYTDPDSSVYEWEYNGNIISKCWHGDYSEYGAAPTVRPCCFDGYNTNYDTILPRMRDYRATHRYASNGTYTITITSYAMKTSYNTSDSGFRVTETTTTYSLTVTDASAQDIIYFKVPKQFDHIYINGVRCPTVEQADDYNVVGLDVTGYNWLLGKICAGRRDVILCKLPLLSTTSYTKYQCRLQVTKELNASDPINVDMTFDMLYDTKSQLYYVDDLATKTHVLDINCEKNTMMYSDAPNAVNQSLITYTASFTITITGVDQNNDATELKRYTGDTFPDGVVLVPNSSNLEDFMDHYSGWEPYFARSSIQVAEFENDYVRNTTDSLPYIRESRSEPKFLSDCPYEQDIVQSFGNDIVRPLTNNASPYYTKTYATQFDRLEGVNSNNAVAILTEACIGKTYDLRYALPWKTFFPSCFCTDSPLSVHN